MCAVLTGSSGTNCGAVGCGLLCTPGGGASTGRHRGQSIKWCSAAASPCSVCVTGLGAHCGTIAPEHRRSTPWAAVCARASGAHTPAATTHSHSASTPVMVRRERCEAGKNSMAGILDKADKVHSDITPCLPCKRSSAWEPSKLVALISGVQISFQKSQQPAGTARRAGNGGGQQSGTLHHQREMLTRPGNTGIDQLTPKHAPRLCRQH